jgi:hypothetical protein
VDYQYTDSTSPGNYITKYLSKMDGRDIMNVMLFTFGLRLYSNSHGLRYAPEIKKETKWKFHSAGKTFQVYDQVNQFLKAGYSLVGRILLEPRGP